MRFATTIVLAIAASCIALYAFLDHAGILRKFLGEKDPPSLVAPLSKAITAFDLRRGENVRTLELKDGRWRLTAPVDDVANPAWIQNALETFAALRATEFIADPEEKMRASYGLNREAAATLGIVLSDGQTLTYQIGGPGPFTDSTYLSSGEADAYEGAFVVTGDFSGIADDGVAAMIDPVLARFDPATIVELTFQQGESEIGLRRNEDPGSRWRLESPLAQQADDDKANALLATLATLPVDDVVLDPDKLPEPSPPAETRVIRLGSLPAEDPIRLTFTPHGEDPTRLWARHSQRPLVYDLPKTVLDGIYPANAESLMERRLLRVVAADISSAILTPQGGIPLRVEHTGAWLVSNGEDGTVLANPEQGERFLALFNETEILQYLDAGADKRALYGLDAPRFVVEMVGENLGPLQADRLVMQVGMPLGDSPNVFVYFEEADFIAAVSKTFLTGLAQASDPLKWKRLEVLNVAFDRIEAISIAAPGKNTLHLKIDLANPEPEQRLRLELDGQDRTADMDKHAAGQMLLDMGNLNAESWITLTRESALALTDPSLIVTIERRAEAGSEAKKWTVQFAPVNAEVPAFYYGQLEDKARPQPFLIKRDLYQRLSGASLLLETP